MNTELERMLDSIERNFKLSSNVKEAMLSIPRELFIPSGMMHIAYKLDALPLGARQFISSPLTVAKMTQYLNIDKNTDSVLEIGLGSGYQAAILSKLIRRVFSIERIERLIHEARSVIKKLEIMNIHTKFADGKHGWEQYAPYDRILFSASINEIPSKIIEQLANDGILVAPILEENNIQIITRFIKKDGKLLLLDKKDACTFVHVKDNVE